jgi:hypothetical protein
VFIGGVGTENDNHSGVLGQGKVPGRHGSF